MSSTVLQTVVLRKCRLASHFSGTGIPSLLVKLTTFLVSITSPVVTHNDWKVGPYSELFAHPQEARTTAQSGQRPAEVSGFLHLSLERFARGFKSNLVLLVESPNDNETSQICEKYAG